MTVSFRKLGAHVFRSADVIFSHSTSCLPEAQTAQSSLSLPKQGV